MPSNRKPPVVFVFLVVFGLALVLNGCGSSAPVQRRPATRPSSYEATGIASYYGGKFHGRRTASGERFDMHAMTAAHPVLPFGTQVQVRRLKTGRAVTVRINDRGPFVKGRIIDLSYAAAKQLGMLNDGLAKVHLRVVASKP